MKRTIHLTVLGWIFTIMEIRFILGIIFAGRDAEAFYIGASVVSALVCQVLAVVFFVKANNRVRRNLLAVLDYNEVCGIDLLKRYEVEVGSSLSYGTLYTAMRALTKIGAVESRDAWLGQRRVRMFKLKS